MADAALFSLKHTILRTLNIQYVNETTKPELELIHNEITSLQTILQRLESSSKRVHSLDKLITDASSTLKDVLKSYIPKRTDVQKSERFQYKRYGLTRLKPEIRSFSDTIKMIKEDYVKVLRPSQSLPADIAAPVRSDRFGDEEKRMVGMDDQLMAIKARVTGLSSKLETVSIIGMPGVGKTLLARKVYEDPVVSNLFPLRAWVPIGPDYCIRETLLRIIVQMNPNFNQTCVESEEELAVPLCKILKRRRYLIVLDDVWSFHVWEALKKYVPNDKKGSRIIITTRLEDVALKGSDSKNIHRVRFLNTDESWDLLKQKVFPEGLCPVELEKVGKKIAETCEGLPLAIITISNLCKTEKTLENWKKIAKDENSLVVSPEDESQLSKVLYKSYEHLPPYLRVYFLYMGVFPRKTNIRVSKLIKLWVSEGFIEPNQLKSLEDTGEGYLQELVSRSLVLVRKCSSRGKIKTCWIHHVFRQLCVYEGEKDKFFHVVNSYGDASFEDKDKTSQRRLCVHKNILFGIKDVSRSFASLTNVCSILCTGPYHPYPVEMNLGFKSLRVLDAFSIRFFKFPMQILKLNQLRYLGFTLNAGKIPAAISRLWNLQVLIVRPHLSVTMSSGSPSFLPVQIWKMQELRHLRFMGSDLPVTSNVRDRLPNLQTLSNVSAQSCTRKVLSKIPNLKKLGIVIELAQDDKEPSFLMHDIALLTQLESFKCTVTTPNPRSRVSPLPGSFLTLPSSLKKLTLRGCGFVWDAMKVVNGLPNLEVLKLQCYSFRGTKWQLGDLRFNKLGFLLLEDLDIEHLIADKKSFPKLHSLVIKHCYKLTQFPLKWEMLRMVEMVDCSPLAEALAKRIKNIGKDGIEIHVRSSLNIETSKS